MDIEFYARWIGLMTTRLFIFQMTAELGSIFAYLSGTRAEGNTTSANYNCQHAEINAEVVVSER